MATSTTHAEYIGQDAAARELEYLTSIIKEIGFKPEEYSAIMQQPVKILGTQGDDKENLPRLFGDNQGAIKLAHNPTHHKLSKHFDIKYHYVRGLLGRKLMVIQHVPGKDNTADIMTKSLGRPVFEKHRSGMGVSEVTIS